MAQETARATERMQKAKRYLRLFMLDTPQLNRLIRREESDDVMMQFAIDMTISDWNSTAPLISPVTIENFPSLYLLMHGAAIQLLKSQGLYQARNELNYSAGGSSFIRSNKTQYYQAWLSNLSSEYELKKRNSKIFKNIEGGYGGGVASEYDRLGYSW